MILCIMQARMNSSRLPGKILKEVYGQTMLEHEVKRVMSSKLIDKLIIATTDSSQDDQTVDICRKNGYNYYRGSEEDVLDRFYQAALNFNAGDDDIVVRITADCPLIDPNILDLVISTYMRNNVDYVSNTNPPTYPDGLDVEVFSFKALKKAWTNAGLKSEREHVTPYIKKNKELFKHINVTSNIDLSHLRWTLDEEEDFAFICEVYNRLYAHDRIFLTEGILDVLKEDSLLSSINSKHVRDAGYIKSLSNDEEVHICRKY